MELDQVTHLDVRGFSRQRISLHIALSLNLQAIGATANTAFHDVMTMLNMNQDDRADHHGAHSDCGCCDLGPARTKASA